VELIHAYSLVHDDLPAMDDDDLRRGRKSCHKAYGESIGVLAGDALLTLSFQILARQKRHAARWMRISEELSRAAGTFGMIGGQVVDTHANFDRRKETVQTYILSHKTGALIAAAVRMGGLAAGASRQKLARLSRYGESVGLVFQLVDDLLDNDGVAKLWGKTQTKKRAQKLTHQAKEAVAPLGKRAKPLIEIADLLLSRET